MRSRLAFAILGAALVPGALVSESAFAHRGGYGFKGGAVASVGGYGYKGGGVVGVGGYGYKGSHYGGYYKSRVVVGVGVGVPVYWGPWWYFPPAYAYPYPYYYPPAVGAYSSPTYIEQGSEHAAPAEHGGNWWYYCADAKAYYPYVRECPGGWQRVAPQPPAPAR
jgi:hypothetical protein